MGDGHVGLPDFGGNAAPGHALAVGAIDGAVIVPPDPHAGNQLARVAHEPGIAVAGAGAGLAGRVREVELRALTGSRLNHADEHLVHLLGRFRLEDPLGLCLVALARIDEFAARVEHVDECVRLDLQAAVRERCITADMRDRCDADIAERHRAGCARAVDAETIDELDDLVAAELEREGNGGRVE